MEDWRDRAACSGRAPLHDPPLPGEGKEDFQVRARRAMDVCRACPVRRHCRRATRTMPRVHVVGIRAGVYFKPAYAGQPSASVWPVGDGLGGKWVPCAA
ncbi:MAG: WhiB family transcriptional regulator [Anaerolineae bacterium]